MMEISVGASHSLSVVVDNTNIASTMGSGLVEVFSTPMMIALMENAASECIRPLLEEGQATVGTQVNITHDAASPIGMTITATATVTAVDRRRVEFTVEARDDVEIIGKGIHTRFIIDTQKFMQKVQAKGE